MAPQPFVERRKRVYVVDEVDDRVGAFFTRERERVGELNGSLQTLREKVAALAFNARVAAADRPNPVQIENARRGSTGWEGPIARGTAVEGYASAVSATPGQPLARAASIFTIDACACGERTREA